MIKTMLLTAQLALSPIVGTNGLQPKCLPNPVYGESVDYYITYEGENYVRMAYVNKETKWNFNAENGSTLYLSLFGISNTEGGYLTSNIGTGSEDEYIAIAYNAGEITRLDEYYTASEKSQCVAFYGRAINNDWFYYEIFGEAQTTEVKIRKYNYNGSSFVFSEQLTNNLGAEIIRFTNYQNRPLGEIENRIIPSEQPTIANPSVYDNIYNFYYQNLFANEALDELNAEVGNNSLTMRQWLAHTATIVSISLLAVALAVLVIKIFKLIAGSISDIWG